MISFLIVFGYVLLVLVLLAGVLATLLGLPGTVLILVGAVVTSAVTHWDRPEWWVLLVLAGLALSAELGDNLLAAAGTKYGGGSAKTGWATVCGGIAGALAGSLVSPVFSLLGGVFGFLLGVVIVPLALAAVGGYLAAYYYEVREGRTPQEARQAGKGALIGKLLGLMGKALLAVMMTAIVLWTVFVPLLQK